MMEQIAKYLMVIGISIVIFGLLIFVISRLNLPIGNLPGDITIERKNFTCIIPIVTSILLSVILTILINLIIRFLGR
ncbi:MAG: DUF2905 domain-containing protein [Anaerolineales bacterium]|nr:DUF2905 domain-containing protein [Anaerolineales bacterium]